MAGSKVTSNESIVSIEITGAEGVQDYLEESKKHVLRLADNLTTKTATKARRTASRKEAEIVHLGSSNAKWVSSKNSFQAGGTWWNPSLGGYRSRRRAGNGQFRRIVNFKNVKTAARYGSGFSQSKDQTSQVRMTSLVANLWEHEAMYSTPSAMWIGPRGKARWNLRGQPTFIRKGRHYFNSTYTAAAAGAIPEAIVEAERKFKEDQAKIRGKKSK